MLLNYNNAVSNRVKESVYETENITFSAINGNWRRFLR